MERDLVKQYVKSSRNLFLLDYDGTIAEFTTRPEDACLTNSQRQILLRLCQNPKNTVVIVSGRDHHTLGAWLGDLPINLTAEYGHFVKEQGKPWTVQAGRNQDWKPEVRSVLQTLVAALPDSLIEEKGFSLVWHYSEIDDQLAQQALEKISSRLRRLAKQHKLVLEPAFKSFEVAVPGIDKSMVADYWLQRDQWGFILAAGDDVADEVLFKAVPKTVRTIKVGKGETAARYRVPDPSAFSELLQEFNTVDQSPTPQA